MYDRLQGVLPEAISEGTHLRVPWVQMPTIMDIRTRPRSISSVTGTKGALRGFRSGSLDSLCFTCRLRTFCSVPALLPSLSFAPAHSLSDRYMPRAATAWCNA